MINKPFSMAILCGALCAASWTPARAAVAPAAVPTVVDSVDAAVTKTLSYDAPVGLHKIVDKGAVADDKVLEHLHLVLKRSAARQAALDKLVEDQLDKSSPDYHKWLSPADFGAKYGPAESDVEKTVSWLTAAGFKVESVSSDRMKIEFTGTARQIRSVFKTELHNVSTSTGNHVANMSAPAIPAALSGVGHGVTLSNFFPRPALHDVGAVSRSAKGKTTIVKRAPGFTIPVTGGYYLAVAPEDLATIYNLTPAHTGSSPLLPGPITGKGVSLVLAEQTDINTSDWTTFRKLFGLSSYKSGKLTVVHPGGCTDPGETGDIGEAALDSEWSSAAAPDAEIVFASCAETATTFGVMTTLEKLLDEAPKGIAISVSYGGCEVGNGLSFQAEWTSLIQKAAAEGIAVFVSAGDNAVAGCDYGPYATGGLAVNGLASSQYDTVAGGTDFADLADGTIGNYWSLNNSKNLGSALSYIPEIPWNNNCSSSVIVKYVGSPGPIHNCNDPNSTLNQNGVGGSGGKSLYYAKPSWQKLGIKGMPSDGARDLPDVSLFAANGIWAHFYVYCQSNVDLGGAPCSTTNVNDILSSAAGGTSSVAPILAGIQALVGQLGQSGYEGPQPTLLGNAAPVYYQLAKLQFDTPYLLNTCKSNLGANISPACVFNELTTGDNSSPCVEGTPNCFVSSSSTYGIGVLQQSKTVQDPAYSATLGYNQATGLGSLNVTNLLVNYFFP